MSFLRPDRATGARASASRSEGSDLLSRFRAGEARAFDDLVEQFAPSLVRLFRRHGVDAAHAEDLAQEVFVRLLRTQSSYTDRGRLHVYLHRVARNVWHDWRRAVASRPGARSIDGTAGGAGAPLMALLAHPSVGPAESLAGRDAARLLTDLLARLPEGERLVLELSLFDGLPYAQIAEALAIPEGTVKSRVFHALRRLRGWTGGKEDLR